MKLLVTLALCAVCVYAEGLARQKRGWQQEPPPPPPPTQSPGWGWKPPPPPPPEKGWNQPPPTQSPGWGWSPPQQQNNGWGWQGGRRSPYDYGYNRPTYGGSKPWGRYERYSDDPYSSYRNEGGPYRYRDFGAIRSSSTYPRRASSQIGF